MEMHYWFMGAAINCAILCDASRYDIRRVILTTVVTSIRIEQDTLQRMHDRRSSIQQLRHCDYTCMHAFIGALCEHDSWTVFAVTIRTTFYKVWRKPIRCCYRTLCSFFLTLYNYCRKIENLIYFNLTHKSGNRHDKGCTKINWLFT